MALKPSVIYASLGQGESAVEGSATRVGSKINSRKCHLIAFSPSFPLIGTS